MLERFVREYRWIHLSTGLIGNSAFVVGSVLYLVEESQDVATVFWLIGSIGMLLGRVGEAIAQGLDHHWRKLDGETG